MTSETAAAWVEVAHALESFSRGGATHLQDTTEPMTPATAIRALAEAAVRAAQQAAARTGRAAETEQMGDAVAYALCAAVLAIPAPGRHAARPPAPVAEQLHRPSGDLPKTLLVTPEGQLIVMTVLAGEENDQETYPLDQLLLVLSGNGECVTGGQRLPLAVSGALCLPSGTAHAVRARGAESLRLACARRAPASVRDDPGLWLSGSGEPAPDQQ